MIDALEGDADEISAVSGPWCAWTGTREADLASGPHVASEAELALGICAAATQCGDRRE
jgi:hypothetical protein